MYNVYYKDNVDYRISYIIYKRILFCFLSIVSIGKKNLKCYCLVCIINKYTDMCLGMSGIARFRSVSTY